MSPAPVQNSVFQFSAPQELDEILKEFSEDRAFPSIITTILPVPLMMQERSRRKSGHFQLHRQRMLKRARPRVLRLDAAHDGPGSHVLLVPWRHHVTLAVGAGRVATVGRQSR